MAFSTKLSRQANSFAIWLRYFNLQAGLLIRFILFGFDFGEHLALHGCSTRNATSCNQMNKGFSDCSMYVNFRVTFSSDLDPLFIRKLCLGTANVVADSSNDSCAGVGGRHCVVAVVLS